MKKILLGNEAIVRGALEAGVQFVSTYPGTPASEIGNTFYKLSQNKEFLGYFEFSTNEKVALEAGVGASFSGLKTLVVMKNFGLNVAADALLPFVYTGTKGPTVIVVADDPSCHSSAQSEENSRAFAYLAHIPVLEPADPQECKDFIKLAYQISAKFQIPVMVRTTTRVAHQKMPVILGKLSGSGPVNGKFVKDFNRFVTLPPRVLEMKQELLAKIKKIKEFAEKGPINQIEGGSASTEGIITSGIAYLYVMEALRELNLSLPVLKLDFFYPLPEKKIKSFIKNLKKVFVIEELEPYLEKEVASLAKEANCSLQIYGKNLISEVGELKPEIIAWAIAKFVNKKHQTQKIRPSHPPVFRRSPILCPGCPYWLIISAIKKAVDVNKVIFGGEIGCYMLFGNSPINLQDYLSCMGSSVGIAHGIIKSSGQKIISFVGDSSFFHAGIPPLINAVFNKSNPLIIILENQTTAMTGHQPHPGMSGIKIEEIVRACGVKNIKTIDPVNQAEFIETIKEFIGKNEVSVIIAHHPCKFVK